MGLNFADISTDSFGDGDSKNFKVLPEGNYTILVDEAKTGVSQAGNEKLSVTFTVLDEGEFKGRKLWHDFPATPKALVFLKYFLNAIGSDAANQKNVELKDIAIFSKNKKCLAWVEQGVTINGNPRNNLSKFKALEEDPLNTEAQVTDSTDAPKKKMFE